MSLPKTKNELKFENRFLDKIEQGIKQKTIRNSPVELGVYELRGGLEVEVYRVTKADMHIIGNDYIGLFDLIGNLDINDIYYEELGFNNPKEGQEFYENYLKHEFCYLIEFRIIKGEDNEKV